MRKQSTSPRASLMLYDIFIDKLMLCDLDMTSVFGEGFGEPPSLHVLVVIEPILIPAWVTKCSALNEPITRSFLRAKTNYRHLLQSRGKKGQTRTSSGKILNVPYIMHPDLRAYLSYVLSNHTKSTACQSTQV